MLVKVSSEAIYIVIVSDKQMTPLEPVHQAEVCFQLSK